MPVVTLRQESIEQGHFYVPQFEIKIAGAHLPRDVLRDVSQVTYKDNIKEIDSFELTVNNWDSVHQRFQVCWRRKRPTHSRESAASALRSVQQRSKCGMGYGGDLRLMMTGTFTTWSRTSRAAARRP